MSDILMAPECQPIGAAIGLLIYAVIAALIAIACGAAVCAIGHLIFRRSHRRGVRIGLPALMAITTIYVVFVVIYSVVCLWAFGVFATPDERLLTPTQPVSEEDMIGTWTLDAESLSRMEEEGGYKISTHTLTLTDDGTFELVNMPDWCAFGGKSIGPFYSGSGTWGVTEYSGGWRVYVYFTILAQYKGGLNTTLNIGGQQPPYYIWTYAGDPDAGRIMVFERQGRGP